MHHMHKVYEPQPRTAPQPRTRGAPTGNPPGTSPRRARPALPEREFSCRCAPPLLPHANFARTRHLQRLPSPQSLDVVLIGINHGNAHFNVAAIVKPGGPNPTVNIMCGLGEGRLWVAITQPGDAGCKSGLGRCGLGLGNRECPLTCLGCFEQMLAWLKRWQGAPIFLCAKPATSAGAPRSCPCYSPTFHPPPPKQAGPMMTPSSSWRAGCRSGVASTGWTPPTSSGSTAGYPCRSIAGPARSIRHAPFRQCCMPT
jgi:hypothetical protein